MVLVELVETPALVPEVAKVVMIASALDHAGGSTAGSWRVLQRIASLLNSIDFSHVSEICLTFTVHLTYC